MSEHKDSASPTLMALKVSVDIEPGALKSNSATAKPTTPVEKKRGDSLSVEQSLYAFCQRAELLTPMSVVDTDLPDGKTLHMTFPRVRLLQASVPLIERESISSAFIGHPFMDALLYAHEKKCGFVLAAPAVWQLIVDGAAQYFHSRATECGIAGGEQMYARLRAAANVADGRFRIFMKPVTASASDGSGAEGCNLLDLIAKQDAEWVDMHQQIVDLQMQVSASNAFFGICGQQVDPRSRGVDTYSSMLRTDGGGAGSAKFSLNLAPPRISPQGPPASRLDTRFSFDTNGSAGIPNYFLSGSLLDWSEMLDAVANMAGFLPLRYWALHIGRFLSLIVLHYRNITPESKWPPLLYPTAQNLISNAMALHLNLQDMLPDFFHVNRAEGRVHVAGHSTLFFPYQIGIFNKDCQSIDDDISANFSKTLNRYVADHIAAYGFDARLFQNRMSALSATICDAKIESNVQILSGMTGFYRYERQNAVAPVMVSLVIFQNVLTNLPLFAERFQQKIIDKSLREQTLALYYRNYRGICADLARTHASKIDNLCDFIADIDAMHAKIYLAKTSKPQEAAKTSKPNEAEETAKKQTAHKDATESASTMSKAKKVSKGAVKSDAPKVSREKITATQTTKVHNLSVEPAGAQTGVAEKTIKPVETVAANVASAPKVAAKSAKSGAQKKMPAPFFSPGKGWMIVAKKSASPSQTSGQDAKDTTANTDIGHSSDVIVHTACDSVAPAAPSCGTEVPSVSAFDIISAQSANSEPSAAFDVISTSPTTNGALTVIDRQQIDCDGIVFGRITATVCHDALTSPLQVPATVSTADACDAPAKPQNASEDHIAKAVAAYHQCERSLYLLMQFLKTCVHPTTPRLLGASEHCCAAHRDSSAAPPSGTVRSKDCDSVSVTLHDAMVLMSDSTMRCNCCYADMLVASVPGHFEPAAIQHSFYPRVLRTYPNIVHEFAEMLFMYLGWVRGGSLMHCCVFCKGEFFSDKSISVVTYGVSANGDIRASIIFHCTDQSAAMTMCTANNYLRQVEARKAYVPTGILCTIYADDKQNRNGTNVRVHALGIFEKSAADLLLNMPTQIY